MTTPNFADGNGNDINVNQNVIITDNTDPETPTLADLTDQCSVTATAPTTTDNCAGTVTGTTSDPTEYTEQGTYTITWNFADGNGNSINVNQNVIINDNTNPETPTLANLIDQCSITAIASTTTDNCAGTVTGTTSDPTEYTEQGTYVITWNFADGNGNSINVNQNVIINDNTNPEAPTLADLTDQCSVTATAPTTTDNCAGTITATTSDPTEYTEQGTYTITWNFADGNGNSINVNQNVIIEDITDPTESNDNCSDFSIANDFNGLSTLENTEFPIGLTTVVWTITDIANNETQCSFDVQVNAFVGIETLQQKGISIYPNPTNGNVNFEFANNNIQKITISDMTGKTIVEKDNIQQNEMIDLSSFENGIYIIKIQTDNEIFTTKIVKE